MSRNVVAVLNQRAIIPGAPHEDPSLGRTARSLAGKLHKPAGMSRYSRLDRYGQSLVQICSEVLDRPAAGDDVPSGLYVASQHSCHETNSNWSRELLEKGPTRASPLLFPYTLPGATASEAAMHFNLTGAYVVMPGGPATALALLLTAADALDERRAGRLVVVAADVLGPSTVRLMEEAGELGADDRPVLAEGAAGLWLGRDDDPIGAPRLIIDADTAAPVANPEACRRLMLSVAERTKTALDDLARIISATSEPGAMAIEGRAAEDLLPERECVHLAWRTGNTGASLGLYAAAAALEDSEPVLVLATDRAASVAMIIRPA